MKLLWINVNFHESIFMHIKELRNKTGLSQSKFAALFSIPVNTLQQWEQELRTPPYYVLYMMREILISKGYKLD